MAISVLRFVAFASRLMVAADFFTCSIALFAILQYEHAFNQVLQAVRPFWKFPGESTPNDGCSGVTNPVWRSDGRGEGGKVSRVLDRSIPFGVTNLLPVPYLDMDSQPSSFLAPQSLSPRCLLFFWKWAVPPSFGSIVDRGFSPAWHRPSL